MFIKTFKSYCQIRQESRMIVDIKILARIEEVKVKVEEIL